MVSDNARTVSVWAKTSDVSGSLLAWGSNGNGRFWDFDIINGNLGLRVNNGRLETSQSINSNTWRHLAVVYPSAAEVLDDVVLYIDGLARPELYQGILRLIQVMILICSSEQI